MFTNISATGTGQLILIIEWVLSVLGLELPEGSVLAVINAIIVITGVVLSIYGQLRRKDLKAGLVRKTPRKS